MGKFRHMLLCAVACGAVVGAPAQAGCWAGGEVAASRVRGLQTMLMVAALKCNAAGIDISGPYNAFVTARRGALEAANGAIRRHYADAGVGQAGYDRFATILANAYSARAETSAQVCGEAAQLALDAADGAADLNLISDRRVAAPALPEGACDRPETSLALADQPKPPAPAALPARAAAAAAGDPVPPEVAAAMAVLAAYARDGGVAAPAVGTATAMARALP